MRKYLAVLAFTATAFAAGIDAPAPDDQGQSPAPAPAAADAAKPADPATPPPPPPKYGGWSFQLLGDVYTTKNGNSPTQDVNQLQNFNLH